MSLPRWQEPNLARAPFVNERPVRRLAVTLWLLFAIAGAAGLWMSQTIRRETRTRVTELTRLDSETASARERATALEAELRRSDLPAQNVRTEFLNRRIAERSFSWNRLLETLTREMPRGVRLLRLSPEGFTRERGRAPAGAQTVATTRVALRITGEAEETEALLEFVDRLFQHPAFDRPNLSRESEKKDFKIQFDLSVGYLPQLADAPVATTPIHSAAGEIGSATPLPSPEPPDVVTRADDRSANATGAAASATARDLSGRLPAQRAGIVGNARVGGATVLDAGAAATTAAGNRPDPAAGRRGSGGGASSGLDEAGGATDSPAGTVEGDGSSRPGSTGAPGAVPTPGAGRKFPFDVLPTPLRPYASTVGGRP